MNQCMEAAGRMSIPVPLKRKSWDDDQSVRPAKRVAGQEYAEQMRRHSMEHTSKPSTPSSLAMPVSILPRPSNDYSIISPPRPPAPELPKKRGRPSRADKAKRDLRPLLPQPASHHVLVGQSPDAPRPLFPRTLPPPSVAANDRAITPPEVYASAARSAVSPPDSSPGNKAKGSHSPTDDVLHPALCKTERPIPGLNDPSTRRVLVE
jgi:hypothetical protein